MRSFSGFRTIRLSGNLSWARAGRIAAVRIRRAFRQLVNSALLLGLTGSTTDLTRLIIRAFHNSYSPAQYNTPLLVLGVAPGGPAVAGRPPRAYFPGVCRSGRPGGMLGRPAVGDSGPLLGPDRKAPKQANISPQTGLYTACSRHRHARFGPGALLAYIIRILRPYSPEECVFCRWSRCKGPLIGSPIGIDAAGKSAQHDDAANLVTQACSGPPLGSSECRISRHSGVPVVELRSVSASSNCAGREGPSF